MEQMEGYLEMLKREELRVRRLKPRHTSYCSRERELSREKYLALLETAKDRGKEKVYLILRILCRTGILIPELRFITEEAVAGRAEKVSLKGKNRVILLPRQLRQALTDYTERKRITSGPAFAARLGTPWSATSGGCCGPCARTRGWSPKRCSPHNPRHLFARRYCAEDKDLSKLADVLGHSDVNTTQIYIISL